MELRLRSLTFLSMLHILMSHATVDEAGSQLQIEAIDERMRLDAVGRRSPSAAPTAAAAATGGGTSGGSSSSARLTVDSNTTAVECSTGNPRIEEISGHLRLFNDRKDTSPAAIRTATASAAVAFPVSASASGALPDPPATSTSAMATAPSSCGNMLCISSVPSYMTVADFLAFAPSLRTSVRHFRALRDKKTRTTMLLLDFRDADEAFAFWEQYNGKAFSSIAPDECRIFRVASFEMSPSSTQTAHETRDELPSCPVCLDRLDAIASGIYTISCNHSFHCDCLAKVPDMVCPVCRYAQSRSLDDGAADSCCDQCGSRESLWMCMLCGSVGCGRYAKGHAQQHFESTQHAYAIELETQRVWDYAGDGYVHRMILDHSSGKMAAIGEDEGKCSNSDAAGILSGRVDKQVLALLDGQREYFDSIVSQLRSQASDHAATARRLQQTEKRLAEVSSKSSVLEEVNKTLLKSVEDWRKKCDMQEMEIADLKEQVRDLLMHVETQDKVQQYASAAGEDVTTAQVSLAPESSLRGKLRDRLKSKQSGRSRK